MNDPSCVHAIWPAFVALVVFAICCGTVIAARELFKKRSQCNALYCERCHKRGAEKGAV